MFQYCDLFEREKEIYRFRFVAISLEFCLIGFLCWFYFYFNYSKTLVLIKHSYFGTYFELKKITITDNMESKCSKFVGYLMLVAVVLTVSVNCSIINNDADDERKCWIKSKKKNGKFFIDFCLFRKLLFWCECVYTKFAMFEGRWHLCPKKWL